MKNAHLMSCDILYNTTDPKYNEDIRKFQGCPTIAVTKGGRIFLGWYSGGVREPDMDNYNCVIYSDDNGKTWSKSFVIIPSSYKDNIHALDIQLFVDPNGVLHICWVQNNTTPVPEKISPNFYWVNSISPEPKPENIPDAKPWQLLCISSGYIFDDFEHSEWEITCENPDADNLVFSEPKFLFHGFLRCKPTFLKNGNWLFCNYDQLNSKYGYSISKDNGKTFERYYGSEKIDTNFDETMAYELDNGAIRLLARAKGGELAESYSYDGGYTWTNTQKSGIVSADSRFFITRMPSGKILLANNDHTTRTNMTVQLLEDEGKTWKYKKCIDTRWEVSYPDIDIRENKIYLTYDLGRMKEKEILFACFTEEDIINDHEINVQIVSKPNP